LGGDRREIFGPALQIRRPHNSIKHRLPSEQIPPGVSWACFKTPKIPIFESWVDPIAATVTTRFIFEISLKLATLFGTFNFH